VKYSISSRLQGLVVALRVLCNQQAKVCRVPSLQSARFGWLLEQRVCQAIGVSADPLAVDCTISVCFLFNSRYLEIAFDNCIWDKPWCVRYDAQHFRLKPFQYF
jgi:hypothetical protein